MVRIRVPSRRHSFPHSVDLWVSAVYIHLLAVPLSATETLRVREPQPRTNLWPVASFAETPGRLGSGSCCTGKSSIPGLLTAN